jgi:hypothetical protein
VSRKRQAGEMSVDITDPIQDSGNLESSVQYQFQAVAIAILGGIEFVSNRSVVTSDAVILVTSLLWLVRMLASPAQIL